VTLYELPGHPFAQPQPMTAAEARDAARRYYDEKLGDIDVWIKEARQHLADATESRRARKHAAFRLHQATESAYICFLLVSTFYFPRSHNIKFLRSLAEDTDKRLTAAWPREQRADRRRFELLKRAYVEARYSDQYDLDPDDLTFQLEAVVSLRDLVSTASEERIADLSHAEATREGRADR